MKRKCPKCGKYREDLIKFNDLPNGKKDLIVDGVEIDKTTFDELRSLVCYYNFYKAFKASPGQLSNNFPWGVIFIN